MSASRMSDSPTSVAAPEIVAPDGLPLEPDDVLLAAQPKGAAVAVNENAQTVLEGRGIKLIGIYRCRGFGDWDGMAFFEWIDAKSPRGSASWGWTIRRYCTENPSSFSVRGIPAWVTWVIDEQRNALSDRCER